MLIEKNKKNKAQAMVIVFVYLSVISLMGIYMMTYASNLHTFVAKEVKHQKALNAAESGMVMAMVRMSNGLGGNFAFTTVTGITVTSSVIGIQVRVRVDNWL